MNAKFTWGSPEKWNETKVIWDFIPTLVDFVENGGYAHDDQWGGKQEKRKKTIKLIADIDEGHITLTKKQRATKVKVNDVQITVEELIKKVKEIIFIK